MWFTSDNAAGIDPVVLDAIVAANSGGASAYGDDPLSARAEALVREVFEAPCARLFPVSTGTAANAIALAALTLPGEAVLCHQLAHIEIDEAGAPEFFTGGKLRLLPGVHALIEPEGLQTALMAQRHGVHAVHPTVLSLSQATERGAVYSVDELGALCGLAHSHGLRVHMDGARFANAVAATGASPAALTTAIGVDVLSLGLSKNGALSADAIVCFDPLLADAIAGWRKRGGQLTAKMRFRAAEIIACLEKGRWLENAKRANAAAARLRDGLLASGVVEIVNRVDANIVFAVLPRDRHERLKAAGARYHLVRDSVEYVEARLVTSFATTDADVDGFLDMLC